MPTTETPMPALTNRLRDTVELLESIAADRSVLQGVPEDDRRRLLQAVASVYHPDRVERRRMAKITERQRKAARVRRDQLARAATGIHALRKKPLFHTPNVFAPVAPSPLAPSHLAPSHFAPSHPRTLAPLFFTLRRTPALLRVQGEVFRDP